MSSNNYLSIYAKSFNWAGFFLPKKIYIKCSTLYDFCRTIDNIVEDFYLTPDYFENELSTLHGSGFSIQPQLTQSAYFRFHNQSEVFKNLYFVGAGTHPGAGVPGVLSSAKVLDKIL